MCSAGASLFALRLGSAYAQDTPGSDLARRLFHGTVESRRGASDERMGRQGVRGSGGYLARDGGRAGDALPD